MPQAFVVEVAQYPSTLKQLTDRLLLNSVIARSSVFPVLLTSAFQLQCIEPPETGLLAIFRSLVCSFSAGLVSGCLWLVFRSGKYSNLWVLFEPL